MPIKELNVDLSDRHTRVNVMGRREILSQAVEGNWATVFKGRGLEFTGYRPYTYSDDASLIDWKASLRSKEILVREFEEFKNFKVAFFLDVSNSMLFTSTQDPKLKAEYAAELTFTLSEAASQTGDAVGLFMFSQDVVAAIPPGFGKGMKKRFERVLGDKKNYGGERNLKRALLEMNSMLSDRAIIVIISDFIGFPDDWERYISLLSTRHQLYAIIIKDPRDRELPRFGGQYSVMNPNGKDTMYIDAFNFANKYKANNLEQEKYILNVFKKFKSSCLVLENGTPFSDALRKFFNTHAQA